MNFKYARHFILLTIPLAVLALDVSAQTAQVTGRVTDTAEAVVPGATVTVTNADTGIARNATTNEEGYYTVPQLTGGSYQVAVSREGFKQLTRPGVTLDEGQTQRLDFALEVGTVAEIVEVTGAAALLERETTTVSTVIPNEKIVELPLLNRNIITLAALAPTVRPVGQFGGLPVSSFDGARVSIGGGSPSTNNLQVDGISAENFTSGGLNIFLSVDATEEFRVITRNPSAEYGRTGGGVINIISKSGTNEFHGTAYEFHRNESLNANEFFINRNGRRDPVTGKAIKPEFMLNQYGATLGGPLIQKKTFFFFNFEGFKLRQEQQQTRTVPTLAQRNGDFRGTLDAQGRQVMIYDPATTRPSGSGFVRDAFANNIIPANRISPVARLVLNSYPLPNQSGNIAGANNYFGQVNVPSDKTIYGIKIDHNFTPERRLSGRYTYDKTFRGDTNIFNNIAEPNESELVFRRDSIALNYTDALTPTLLMEAKAGLNRYAPTRITRSIDFDLTSLGFSPTLNDQVQLRQYPRFNITDIATIGASQGDQLIQANNSYTAGVNFTKTLATQTLKFGIEQRVYQLNNTQIAVPVAQFDFGRSFTQGPNPNTTGANVGYGLATFLLGTPTGGAASRFAVSTYTAKNFGIYVQDDYKVTPKLTLNLGLRWEYEGPVTDRYDAIANFDPDLQQTINGVAFRGGLIYPGVGELSRGARNNSFNDFGPRVGFAYQLFERTVVRGGYGVYYLPGTGVFVALGRTGFDQQTPLVATNPAVNGNFSPVANFGNPFTNGLVAPVGNAGGPTTGFGTSIAAVLRDTERGYSQQWNLNAQHELPGSFVVEVGYVGNRGVGLPAQRNLDYLPFSVRQQFTAAQLQQSVPNPYFGIITTGGLAAANVQRQTLLDTYPQFSGVTVLDDFGSSIYHAGTLKVERRFTAGLSVLASYTFSKLIDNNLGNGANGFADGGNDGLQDPDDFRAERSISSNDLPQRFVLSTIYELPFGNGRRFSGGRILNAIFGGFQINPILTLQSGNPIGITTGAGGTLFSGFRPNLVGDPRPDDPTIDRFFNPAAFQAAAERTPGNAPRNLPNYRTDGLTTLDISLIRNIAIRENMRLQLRAEAFNATNTPTFGQPGTGLNTGTFGVITTTVVPARQVQLAAKFIF